MSDFTVGISEVDRLATDLGAIPGKVVPQVEAVMKKGAQNIKEAQQAEFKASKHFHRIAEAVSYDRRGFLGLIGYEIGPTIGGAGSLAGIAVDGGARGGGGTVDIDHTLADEVPNVVSELEKALGKAFS